MYIRLHKEDTMFTLAHFVWIGLCAIVICTMTLLSLRLKFPFKTAALVMAAISLASEVSKILSHMEFVNGADVSEGMVIDAGALPLHLCSLFIFAFFYLPFCKNNKLKRYLCNLTVPVAFIGATLAILMATSGTDFTQPEAYQCFLYHAGMIWFAIYLVATKQVNLGWRSWLTNILSLLVMAVAMIWVNGVLQVYDTNFFYVVRPPVDGLPLLNLDHGWYAYFGALALCGLVGITAVHLPAMLKESKAKTKQ